MAGGEGCATITDTSNEAEKQVPGCAGGSFSAGVTGSLKFIQSKAIK
jgi:hypothetical protein